VGVYLDIYEKYRHKEQFRSRFEYIDLFGSAHYEAEDEKNAVFAEKKFNRRMEAAMKKKLSHLQAVYIPMNYKNFSGALESFFAEECPQMGGLKTRQPQRFFNAVTFGSPAAISPAVAVPPCKSRTSGLAHLRDPLHLQRIPRRSPCADRDRRHED